MPTKAFFPDIFTDFDLYLFSHIFLWFFRRETFYLFILKNNHFPYLESFSLKYLSICCHVKLSSVILKTFHSHILITIKPSQCNTRYTNLNSKMFQIAFSEKQWSLNEIYINIVINLIFWFLLYAIKSWRHNKGKAQLKNTHRGEFYFQKNAAFVSILYPHIMKSSETLNV